MCFTHTEDIHAHTQRIYMHTHREDIRAHTHDIHAHTQDIHAHTQRIYIHTHRGYTCTHTQRIYMHTHRGYTCTHTTTCREERWQSREAARYPAPREQIEVRCLAQGPRPSPYRLSHCREDAALEKRVYS